MRSDTPAVCTTDVILVGAGPIGIEMAVALQQAGISYEHFEAKQFAHTISWFPRYARFFSGPERIAICGVPLQTIDQSKATREEYLSYLAAVVQQFELPIHAYEPVTNIQRDADGKFAVATRRAGSDRHWRASKIVLAVGDMHHPRELSHANLGPVPGVGLPHVRSYFDEPHPYIGQRLLIVGGRNSAVEAAIRCHRAGAQVVLSYRRPALDASIKYWLKPEIDWLIKTGAIEFHGATVPVQISAEDVALAPCDDDGQPIAEAASHRRIGIDHVLLLIGYQMDTTLFKLAGITLLPPNGRPDVNTETNESNVPGLYIAGTAVAGSQLRYKLFIENCHCHVVRILRHLVGQDPTHINPLAYSRLHEQPLMAES